MPPTADPTPRSYDFKAFSDAQQQRELQRLEQQVKLFIHREYAVLQRLGLEPGMQVLDIGCGPGFLAAELERRSEGSGSVEGIDRSNDLIAWAQAQVLPQHPRLRLHLGDALALPMADNSYDFVISRFLYQHLPDPLAALREAHRVTRPGGRVCVTDVDDSWSACHPPSPTYERLQQLSMDARSAIGADRAVGHKLPWMFAQAGLREIRTELLVVSSHDIGLEPMVALALSFKEDFTADQDPAELLRQLHSELRGPTGPASLLIGIFMVSGIV